MIVKSGRLAHQLHIGRLLHGRICGVRLRVRQAKNYRNQGCVDAPNPCHTWPNAVEFPIRIRLGALRYS
jgi:hypothetical protein